MKLTVLKKCYYWSKRHFDWIGEIWEHDQLLQRFFALTSRVRPSLFYRLESSRTLIKPLFSQRAANQFLRWLEKRLYPYERGRNLWPCLKCISPNHVRKLLPIKQPSTSLIHTELGIAQNLLYYKSTERCIACDIDDNNCVILRMLDLSASFDTVNHELLLRRLEDRFGVKGNALRWFKSYFSGRKQFVSIGKDRSLSRTLKFGLPQGSMLGPLLYSL